MEYVYCTNCKYFRLCDEGKPYCRHGNTCNINDYDKVESSKDRPHYSPSRIYLDREITEKLYSIDKYIDTDVYDDTNKWYEENYEELFDFIVKYGQKVNPFFYQNDSYDNDAILRVQDRYYRFSEISGQGTYRVIVEMDEKDLDGYSVHLDDILTMQQEGLFSKEVASIKLLDRSFNAVSSIVDNDELNIDGVEVNINEIKDFIIGKIMRRDWD